MAQYLNPNNSTIVLFSLSAILFAGFLVTRLTKLAQLPNVTGYIIAGILIGPGVLKIVSHEMVCNMGFVSDIALAFIAFGVGRFFTKDAFKQSGFGVVVITLMESLVAGALVTVLLRLFFGLDWSFCLLLGAIATATAPASTMVTIRQYRARGNFVNTLLQVVALDDAVCLVVFSIAIALVNAGAGNGFALSNVLVPTLYNAGALAAGFLAGILLTKLMTPSRSEDNRLILTIAILLGLSSACAAVGISPLLSCMLFGSVYINVTGDRDLFRQVERFSPPVLAMFFVVSGMSLDLGALGTLGIVGTSYFLIRIIGKYIGAYVGSVMAGAEKNVRDFLGLALVPQAGVAIGLAFLGKRVLPSCTGDMLLAVILSSSVLYEMVGPISAKTALVLSGSISRERLAANGEKLGLMALQNLERVSSGK